MSLADDIGNIGRAIQTRIYREGVYGRKPAVPVDPERLRRAARSAMSRRGWNYLQGSAGTESTASANRAAFERYRIVPSMLRDVSNRRLGVELFGRELPTPLLLAPIGVLELVHPQGDLAVARAAADSGVPVMLSTQASWSMERVAEAAPQAPRWFQLYWSSDDDLVTSMVHRAERSGCEAIVVTLDTHVLGWRPRDLDAGFLPFAHGQGIAQYTADPVFASLVRRRLKHPASSPAPRPTPQALRALWSMSRNHPGSLLGNLRSPCPRAAVETFLDVFSRSSLTWHELDFVRQRTKLPIVLKGLQRPEDARRALDAGVDGVVVSNHGGRQVDGALGALEALPGIVAEVDGRIPVLFDSGVRTGADVFKALALGATAVGIGRPYAYGLATAGARGVRSVLEHLGAELDITMALAGIADVAGLGPAALTRLDG
ncbi:lactate 2-monooxygenase [Actinopolyspora erythraea]|uniref:Lactate 2-monooxygenase n=1 Tax=Actinopolyspora erythraea TaxID=414996 RepID=A0A099D5W1_9ACTN|nr:lactate 2-monooxygenase [Actinopolyspora erythraea]ASU78746.1 lactate 2-monooxygenase [Actinopolyspora erythraea]KGI81503.1 lactate 2-monooxygenase [Actinopolyspora erythraea]